jgi:2',3'-cyclic-nucleotide 2'-phosphodiesterase (5'-nucleotidase family)
VRRANIWILAPCLLIVAACGGAPSAERTGTARSEAPAPPPRKVRLAIIGTSDLHGHIEMLPMLAGHMASLRASGRVDDVVMIDGGDMFQGTLESNLNEGAAVVEGYNHIGYAAVAVGNHEFDFGPAGERPVPRDAGDDPRGALKARAAEAKYPFLAANLLDSSTGKRIAWPHFSPTVLIERAGVRIGIIGVTTESTPRTTMASNFAGLAMKPLAETIAADAAELRRRGAQVVLVAAHAGGRCRDFEDPKVLESCAADEEIFEAARALPPGAVDVIVGGHTHQGVAHEVAGVAIVQSFAKGVAFGRVDLVVESGRRGRVLERRIHPPRSVCGARPPEGRDHDAEPAPCKPEPYEGVAVVADEQLAAMMERHVAAAREVRDSQLGVFVESAVRRSYAQESALGNLFADLMRAATRGADVAITNGGGLRADLPAGPLTYGALYQAMPFDNRFARVKLTGAQLAGIVARNLQREGGIFSLSGVRATARCRDGKVEVTLRRDGGRRVRDGDKLVLVTSDFLASGGDGMLAGLDLPDGAIVVDDGAPIRDVLAAALRARGGKLRGDDRRIHDSRAPRISLPGPRPLRCP